MEAVMRKK